MVNITHIWLALLAVVLFTVLSVHADDVPTVIVEEAVLQTRERSSSLAERAKSLRAVAEDLKESAKLLFDRADALSQQAGLILEERVKEKQQKYAEYEASSSTGASANSKAATTKIRLRKNRTTSKGCATEVCQKACKSDCDLICNNLFFARPEECDSLQFCDTTCSQGCKADACEFRFDFDLTSILGETAEHR